jgi:hypothetical protein
MKSADSERDFNGFLRTVCVEPVDIQKLEIGTGVWIR